jgi:hypothetical protein
MSFDYVTWSIWLIGLVILITWIVVPYREFRALLKRRSAENKQSDADEGGNPG